MQINNTNNDTYAPSYSSSYTRVSTAGAGTGSDSSIQAGGGNQASNNTTPPLEPKGSFPDAVPRNNEVFGLRDRVPTLPPVEVPPRVPVQTDKPGIDNFGLVNVGSEFVNGDHGIVPNRPDPVDTTGALGQGFDGLLTRYGLGQSEKPPQSGQQENTRPNNAGFLPEAPPRQFFQFQHNYVQPVQVWHEQPSINYFPDANKISTYDGKNGKPIDIGDLYIPRDGNYNSAQLNFIGAYNDYVKQHG